MATEKRLIDANALSNSISGIGKDMKRPRAVELACLCLIADAPTVDAMEVVRCKDCSNRHTIDCSLFYGETNRRMYFIDRGENFSCVWEKGEKNNE